jgi:cytoskeletal protein RodZ
MNQLSPSQSDQLREIGTYLKQQRLEKSLTLEEIAAMTMIRLQLLQALEEGDVEPLPELIYVKGFIRRYGEALGIDGQGLASRLQNIPPPAISEALAPSVTTSPPMQYAINKDYDLKPSEKKGVGWWLVPLLGGLGLLGSLLYFFLKPPAPQPEPVVTPSLPPSPVVVASPKPTPPPKSRPVAVPLVLKVSLEEDAWLKITVDGQTVQEGILEADSSKTWQGKKSITMRSGNAGAVKFSVNGQASKSFGKLGEVKEITLTP